MISVGIVGATGYTGVELIRLLVLHPSVEIKVVTSNSEKGRAVADVFPGLRTFTHLEYEGHDSPRLAQCDLVFFATPHATAMHYVPKLLDQGCKVIDLSADFRIKDPEIWQEWYAVKHACPELLESAVYGLPELNREEISKASLIANPGCYPTAITLALLPAIKQGLIETNNIIADAKSGISGAGRKAALTTQYSEVSESFKAYNVSGHRHLPEITQTLALAGQNADLDLTFVPHLVPMNRGMFVTIYVKLNEQTDSLQKQYSEFYANERFVDVMPAGSHPDTRSVRASNQCQIAIHQKRNNSGHAVILSVIDNLVKGAAGQAIQNMNLMYDFDEDAGLVASGLIP